MATHRYWRLSITAAKTDATGVVSINSMIFAESAGGPDTAAGNTISAVSAQGGFSETRAIDGDFTTNWVCASGAFPRTIQIDYGASSGGWKDIAEVRLTCMATWAPQAPKDYTLDYSDNGSSWTTALTVTGETSWVTTSGASGEYMSRTARTAGCPDTLPGYLYYRLAISAGVDTTQVAIGEMEFRDTVGGTDRTQNLATSYSSQSGGNTARNAFDNNNSNGWFATPGFPYTIGNELPRRYQINEVSIIPFSGFQAYAPKDFKIQGSNDNSAWTDLLTVTGQTGWSANPTARTFTISWTTDAVGAAAATMAAAGVGTAIKPAAGAAAVTATATGVGAATKATAGAAAVTVAATGVGGATAAGTGSAAGALSASGVGGTIVATDGAAGAAFVATGIGASIAASAGAASISSAVSGAGATETILAGAGAASISISAAGAGSSEAASSGLASVALAAGAIGGAIVEAVGTSEGALTVTGAGSALVAAAGVGGYLLTASAVGEQLELGVVGRRGFATIHISAVGVGAALGPRIGRPAVVRRVANVEAQPPRVRSALVVSNQVAATHCGDRIVEAPRAA